MSMAEQLSENSRQGFSAQKPRCIGLESDLSRNMRWGCGHVYDETPVGIVVYVRNDPVNLVDPDGRMVWGAVSELQYLMSMGWSLSRIASLPFVNGISGGQNPFDSYYFQYMLYQDSFNAYQYLQYLFGQSAQPQASASTGNPNNNAAIAQQNAANGMSRAMAALANPDCAKIFGWDVLSGTGVADPTSILNALSGGGNDLFKISYAAIYPMQSSSGTTIIANATAQPFGVITNMATGMTNNVAQITINIDLNTSFNSGGVDYQAVTILHELAHAFNIVYGAGTTKIFSDNSSVPNNTQVSAGNTEYIRGQCGL